MGMNAGKISSSHWRRLARVALLVVSAYKDPIEYPGPVIP